MLAQDKVRKTIAVVTGALMGAVCTLVIVYFDSVRAWFYEPRWNYPELADVGFRNCKILGLPMESATYAIVVQKGDLLTELVIPKRALHDTRAIEVVVTRRDKPVVLVLSAKHSVIWEISIIKGVRLAAILILGEDPQGIVGIPKSIPHLVLSAGETSAKCPSFKYTYAKSMRASEFTGLDQMVSSFTGRHIDYLQSAGLGSQFYAGPRMTLADKDLIQSDELKAIYHRTADVMPPGRDGLEWLMNKRLIRPATLDDVDGWIIGATSTNKPIDRRLRTSFRMMPGRVFVILGKIAIPDGLRWDGDYSFVLPDGTPEPDYVSKVRIFSMKDFTCRPRFACRR